MARLFDFFSDGAAWPRRLWDAGTILSLKELTEASKWVDAQVLGSSAVKWLGSDLSRILGKDVAVGERELRQHLQQVLKSDLVYEGKWHRQLGQLTDLIEDGYLTRWKLATESSRKPAPERVARAIGAHLLDLGYSTTYLFSWIRALAADRVHLSDIIAAAQELSDKQPQVFEVLAPFAAIPGGDHSSHSAHWRSARDTSAWFKGLGLAQPRHNGGFLYKIRARDEYSAAAEAFENVERLMARSTFANKTKKLVALDQLWVSGMQRPVPSGRSARGTYILSLEAEGQLFPSSKRTSLDNALELATPLNDGPPGPAISGGWSAIEALLVSPKDTREDGGRGNVAAERMAALVACSWPRAEMTALAHKHSPLQTDRLLLELKGATTNRERSRLIADALLSPREVAVTSDSDRAAVARMKKLVGQPRATLKDVEKHVTSAMRRFYRHRNIVMHGGATTVPTLSMALRTAAPLVGAGLDRITHSAITGGPDPLNLAMRARE